MRRAMTMAGMALLAGTLAGGPAEAAVTTYQGATVGDTTFNADAGNPVISITFEALVGQNIAGSTISGVTFSSPSGNTLDVVNSTSTPAGFSGVINAATNVLVPTSGVAVLSPGGSSLVPGPALAQSDGLQLVFSSPLKAFGLDVLLQSADCCSFTDFQVFNSSDVLIASGGLIGGGGGGGDPGAPRFLGFVSDAFDIKRIVINEGDGDATFPDANTGFDTFRFGAQQTDDDGPSVPGPSTVILLGLGLAVAAWRLPRR